MYSSEELAAARLFRLDSNNQLNLLSARGLDKPLILQVRSQVVLALEEE